jgi:hypothetical protein
MSGVKDPFEILADEITLIRRQVDHLQRTSLDKTEAKQLNAVVADSLARMAKLAPNLQQLIDTRLQLAVTETRLAAIEAAERAARVAITETHVESLKAAQSLSQAAGEARKQAWRYFGGFWVWLASIGATGALLGALVAFWITGRGDAREFGEYPRIYCTTAGGQIVTNTEGRRFCAMWIDPPAQQDGE